MTGSVLHIFKLSKKRISCFVGLILLLGICQIAPAQDTSLKLHYSFNTKLNTDSIIDETGNGYDGRLMGDAKVNRLGAYGLLTIGGVNGYVDMGTKTGAVIGALSNFSISTYLYVDPAANLTANGNFVWSFSNSANIATSPLGCFFYTAKNSRYAITSTNYTAEREVKIGTAATKGAWKHITYTQSGTTGTVFIDGVAVKTGTVNLLPSTLGFTSFNYLCKSAYTSDQILLNSMLCDFRIYNRAITPAEAVNLAVHTAKLDTLLFTRQVETVAADLLANANLSAVTSGLTLPVTGANGVIIQWTSSNTAVVSNTGMVNRPAYGSDTARVVLTARITRSFISKYYIFNISVVPQNSDQECVIADAAGISIPGNLANLRSNLLLPVVGTEGSTIRWTSDKPEFLSNAGAIISRPAKGSGKAKIILTASVVKGTSSAVRLFEVSVAEDEGFAAYLFAYFTGNHISQEAIRFALSTDGYTYRAVNNNNPVVSSSSISSTGGVRDPHVLRGENNDYYMVVTDMVSANGWSSNRAMVLLKSANLTDWTSSIVNIPATYVQYSAADRIWAPQTIYDPSVGKYMVYFSMRLGSGDVDKIYYAYANSSFTALESAPRVLFANPAGTATIDADIVWKDGKYHMFFKTEGSGNGIKKAVSDKLTEGYVMLDKYLQATTNAVEGGCVFRLYNTDTWILMYDMYTSGAYQFTTSSDLESFAVASIPVSFDFTPRHGTVIPITSAELQSLKARWVSTGFKNGDAIGTSFNIYPNPVNGTLNVAFTGAGFQGARLSIIDISGKCVFETMATSDVERISIGRFKPGMYILKYENKDIKTGYSKFVVR